MVTLTDCPCGGGGGLYGSLYQNGGWPRGPHVTDTIQNYVGCGYHLVDVDIVQPLFLPQRYGLWGGGAGFNILSHLWDDRRHRKRVIKEIIRRVGGAIW